MILVTRINKVEQFYVNEDKIEFIEETPDTIISLESGKKIVVMESAALVISRIYEVKGRLMRLKESIDASGELCEPSALEAGV